MSKEEYILVSANLLYVSQFGGFTVKRKYAKRYTNFAEAYEHLHKLAKVDKYWQIDILRGENDG